MAAENKKKGRGVVLLVLLILFLILIIVSVVTLTDFLSAEDERGYSRESHEDMDISATDSKKGADSLSEKSGTQESPVSGERDTLVGSEGDTIGGSLGSDHPGKGVKEQEHIGADDSGGGKGRSGSGESKDQAVSDTGEGIGDTSRMEDSLRDTGSAEAETEIDTLPPYVYADPAGGRHYKGVRVEFVMSEPGEIFWRFEDREWEDYKDPVEINERAVIEYRAVDTAGNESGIKSAEYVIEERSHEGVCPEGMVFIDRGDMSFCIDKYEWPNKRETEPTSFISKYAAQDSCFSRDKRLCTRDEWEAACSGPDSWKYTYGNTYQPRACASDTAYPAASGKKPECRGYYGVYDMSGNLAEWTDTKASENSSFFYVMGGFYKASSNTGCFSSKYSYYPENRHNSVGFRCCSDVEREE